MDLKAIENDLKSYLESKNLHLFELNYHKSDQTLTILLDDKLDLDGLEEISNDLSNYMDKYENDIEGNYILDVSTVGCERPIRNEEELIKAIGEYIYVKTKEDEVYGYLKKYENGILSIDYKEKNIDKIKNIEYTKTKKVRYAVKF
ncbi:MAG: hypothetical protein Q4E33_02755 [Erysipelotrichaceae bacterium]|nr:hypothetical protein [Erysipelotrichaceae bacterium]